MEMAANTGIEKVQALERPRLTGRAHLDQQAGECSATSQLLFVTEIRTFMTQIGAN